MEAVQSITSSTKLLRCDIRKFKTITNAGGAAQLLGFCRAVCHVLPPCGDEKRYMVMFSVGLKLVHCVVQVSLTMANQDSFLQRIKASEKFMGLPDQTALPRQWVSNSVELRIRNTWKAFP